jgi:hypothetical protein
MPHWRDDRPPWSMEFFCVFEKTPHAIHRQAACLSDNPMRNASESRHVSLPSTGVRRIDTSIEGAFEGDAALTLYGKSTDRRSASADA